MERSKTVCFSGHRTKRLPKGESLKELENLLYIEICKVVNAGFNTFLFGACFGFDFLAASQVLKIKKEKDLKLIAVVPFRGQEERWPSEWRQRYNNILGQCDKIMMLHDHYCKESYFDRNRYMVDNSSLIICYYDGGAGGTAQTVNYAKTKIKVINLYPNYHKDLLP